MMKKEKKDDWHVEYVLIRQTWREWSEQWTISEVRILLRSRKLCKLNSALHQHRRSLNWPAYVLLLLSLVTQPMNDWFYIRQQRVRWASQYYFIHHRVTSCTRWFSTSYSSSASETRDENGKRIYDLFVFLYPLNIITFHVYKMCQSHSAPTMIEMFYFALLSQWECEKWENVWRDEMNAVAVWDESTLSLTSLDRASCKICMNHFSKSNAIKSITLIKSTLSCECVSEHFDGFTMRLCLCNRSGFYRNWLERSLIYWGLWL